MKHLLQQNFPFQHNILHTCKVIKKVCNFDKIEQRKRGKYVYRHILKSKPQAIKFGLEYRHIFWFDLYFWCNLSSLKSPQCVKIALKSLIFQYVLQGTPTVLKLLRELKLWMSFELLYRLSEKSTAIET